MTAGLLHSLRAKREVEEEVTPIPKHKDTGKVGSRISSKFMALYTTDEEDNGMFYQPKSKTKNVKEDQKYVVSCYS